MKTKFYCQHCTKVVDEEPNITGNSEYPVIVCNECLPYYIQELPTQKKHDCNTCIHYDKVDDGCIRPKTLPQCEYTKKQSTVEETANEYIKEWSFFTASTINQKRLSFIDGANWQKEQDLEIISCLKAKIEALETMILMRYTEEEVLELLSKLRKDIYPDSDGSCSIHPNGQELPVLLKDWFENNKKK